MNEKTLGSRIKELRKRNGLTLQEFALVLDTSASYLSEIERDKKMPGGEFFFNLKRKLNISLDALFDPSGAGVVCESDTPYIAKVVEMMRSMDDDTQKDVELSVSKEKLLRDLLKQQEDKQAG